MADANDVCAHCGGSKDIRNPSGACDHLYWPDCLSYEARLANGFEPTRDQIIERQQQVIDTLVEALRPFAALTACLECVVPSTETVTIEVRQGDLVGALAAVMLAEAKQNPNRAREAKVEDLRILGE